MVAVGLALSRPCASCRAGSHTFGGLARGGCRVRCFLSPRGVGFSLGRCWSASPQPSLWLSAFGLPFPARPSTICTSWVLRQPLNFGLFSSYPHQDIPDAGQCVRSAHQDDACNARCFVRLRQLQVSPLRLVAVWWVPLPHTTKSTYKPVDGEGHVQTREGVGHVQTRGYHLAIDI